MAKKEAKKYTLFDGFDKIDLSQWSTMFTNTQELTAQRPAQDSGPFGTDAPAVANPSINAYNQKFLANPQSFKFMPDMFRFLTGRRFYINPIGGAWSLAEPPGYNSKNFSNYKNVGEDGAHREDFYMDTAGKGRIQDDINANFNLMGSKTRFQSYFSAFEEQDRPILRGFSAADPGPALLTPFENRQTALSDLLENAKIAEKITESARPIALGSFSAPGPWSPLANNSIFPIKSLAFVPLNHEIASPGMGDLKAALFGTDQQLQILPAIYAQLMFLPFAPYEDAMSRHPLHTYFVADFTAAVGRQSNPLLGAHTAVTTINPYYTYYNEFIEDAAFQIGSEMQLPNPYTYNAFKSLSTPTAAPFRELITLGQITDLTQKTLSLLDYVKLTRKSGPIKKLQSHSVTVAPTLQAIPMDHPDFKTPHRYRTIILSDKALMNSTKNLKKAFPFGVEIDLGPQFSSPLMHQLQQAGPGKHHAFITMLANQTTNFNPLSSRAHRFVGYRPFADVPIAEQDIGGALQQLSTLGEKFTLADLQIFDLSQALGGALSIEEFYKIYGKFIDDEVNVHISPYQFSSGAEADELWHAVFEELSPIVKKYLTDKQLSMEEIYKGHRCHTEVVAYEIAKFKRTAGPDGALQKEYIQSVFIPNSFDSDCPLGYLDTQVFYGGDYVYEIFAHTLIAGSVYRFADHESGMGAVLPGVLGSISEEANGYAYAQYDYNFTKHPIQTPYGIIVRAPYYNTEFLLPGDQPQQNTLVLDKPPLPPDITFHPYKDKEDKVLLLLNQNYGERALIPNTQIFEEDSFAIAAYKTAQKYENKPQGHLLYKTDDNVGRYEIYRLNKKPNLWADFRDLTRVKNISLHSHIQSGIDDIISPNVDYYYFARFVDVHGNFSNPTNIFKLRMVKDESTPPYMILKPFKFDRPSPLTHIPFKKYLKIALSDDMRSIGGNDAATAAIDYAPPTGGTFKKYKFRITSTKTGKKIDINLDLDSEVINKYLSPIGVPKSEVQLQGEELINDVNIVNSSDELCGD